MLSIIIILILFTSCNKENIIDLSKQEGLLKSIKISYNTLPVSYEYTFSYYSLDGRLRKVLINEKDSIVFTYDTSGSIEMNLYPSGKRWIISKTGSKITGINEILPGEIIQASYRFVYGGDNIDSIFEPDQYPIAENIKYYGIVYDGKNYSSSLLSYIFYNFSTPIYHTDELQEYTYTTRTYDNRLVMQGIHSRINPGWESFPFIDPLFCMGLNGYNAYTPNGNLVKSWNEVQYQYAENSNGQISTMKLITPATPDPDVIFRMNYY